MLVPTERVRSLIVMDCPDRDVRDVKRTRSFREPAHQRNQLLRETSEDRVSCLSAPSGEEPGSLRNVTQPW